MVPPATRGYSRPGGPDLALVFGVVDQSGEPPAALPIDVVREAVELIDSSASPAHLQAPDFRIYGGALGIETPGSGWEPERALANLDEREVRTRALVIEPLDDERVYVEAAMGMLGDRAAGRSGELIASIYTVRDGLIVRVDISSDVDEVRRRAGLPPRDA